MKEARIKVKRKDAGITNLKLIGRDNPKYTQKKVRENLETFRGATKTRSIRLGKRKKR